MCSHLHCGSCLCTLSASNNHSLYVVAIYFLAKSSIHALILYNFYKKSLFLICYALFSTLKFVMWASHACVHMWLRHHPCMCTVHALTNGIYNSQYTSILCSLCLPPKVEVFFCTLGKSAEKKQITIKAKLKWTIPGEFPDYFECQATCTYRITALYRLAEDLSYT